MKSDFKKENVKFKKLVPFVRSHLIIKLFSLEFQSFYKF